ncbi:MAG TPA: GerW family sporulation protein [Candidatus Egerieicola faecale]|uniref:GerW family sporulation protein n=1 Tax=Candidatus Egerieicola faecale TaxID=2840774 RepID=A0A9D1IRZ3_9FIRM|nr:GerW family sporulation protein [Candidatus Egerieicola faecale]
MNEHPIQGLMGTTMEKIRDMVDVNTIIGDPIVTPDGTTIIPVSKVSFGFASGGSDIPAKVPKEVFGGGSGAGVSIQPLGFLVVHQGDVRLLEMNGPGDSMGKALGLVPDVISKISDLFKKDKEDQKPNETAPAD